MATITILAGNTDHKLSQQRWSDMVRRISDLVDAYASEVHFRGGAQADHPWQNYCWDWQNYCWVLVMSDTDAIRMLKWKVADVAAAYGQDAIAWVQGATEFLCGPITDEPQRSVGL